MTLGGVEAGGAKFVCAIGSGPDDLVRATIPTTTPAETLARVIEFFHGQARSIAALGVASFGPVDLDPRSPTFGFITSTPKPEWSNVDICGVLRRALGGPIAFETDVNAAALAEARWGAAQGLNNILYITVGTGIGGGALVDGLPLHGLVHPEMGHILIPQNRDEDPFPGACPFHGNCLEGLASGHAMERRWGVKAQFLEPDHPAWRLEAHYLGLALANLVCVLSPRRIVIGGGVMHNLDLFPMIRENLREALNGYVQAPDVVPPLLGDDAGVLGAIALAERLITLQE
ncbi:MAG TPA: ROK family protein [Bryobacteraceae bacterium]